MYRRTVFVRSSVNSINTNEPTALGGHQKAMGSVAQIDNNMDDEDNNSDNHDDYSGVELAIGVHQF
jgi:hypothetical protein